MEPDRTPEENNPVSTGLSQISQEKPGGNTKTPGFNQNYRWCFTLKYDESIKPSQLSQHLKTFCKKFTFQVEFSNSGYMHYQGQFSLNNKEYFNGVKNLFGHHEVHLEPTKNLFAAEKYTSKTETRVFGPFDEKSVFIKTIEHLRPWQQRIMDIANKEPDDRSIYWFWENIGNSGKTSFCKYLAVHHNATFLNNGAFRDLAYSIEQPKIVVVNLVRSNEDHFNYGAIEAIKDGILYSTKYECGVKIFNPPHVFIFANFPPDKDKMSMDRWKIVPIVN